jgi:hypothetical protein
LSNIDAINHLKRLILTNCFIVTGSGLGPVHGSLVYRLQLVDLSLVGPFENPRIEVETEISEREIISFVDSIIERQESSLKIVQWPRKFNTFPRQSVPFSRLKQRFDEFIARDRPNCIGFVDLAREHSCRYDCLKTYYFCGWSHWPAHLDPVDPCSDCDMFRCPNCVETRRCVDCELLSYCADCRESFKCQGCEGYLCQVCVMKCENDACGAVRCFMCMEAVCSSCKKAACPNCTDYHKNKFYYCVRCYDKYCLECCRYGNCDHCGKIRCREFLGEVRQSSIHIALMIPYSMMDKHIHIM